MFPKEGLRGDVLSEFRTFKDGRMPHDRKTARPQHRHHQRRSAPSEARDQADHRPASFNQRRTLTSLTRKVRAISAAEWPCQHSI